MRSTEPGLARDSCPYCGERAQLKWWNFLPQKGRSYVRCAVCKEESQIAAGTSAFAMFTGMAVGGLVMYLAFSRTTALPAIGIAFLTWNVVATFLNWLVLRLEFKE